MTGSSLLRFTQGHSRPPYGARCTGEASALKLISGCSQLAQSWQSPRPQRARRAVQRGTSYTAPPVPRGDPGAVLLRPAPLVRENQESLTRSARSSVVPATRHRSGASSARLVQGHSKKTSWFVPSGAFTDRSDTNEGVHGPVVFDALRGITRDGAFRWESSHGRWTILPRSRSWRQSWPATIQLLHSYSSKRATTLLRRRPWRCTSTPRCPPPTLRTCCYNRVGGMDRARRHLAECMASSDKLVAARATEGEDRCGYIERQVTPVPKRGQAHGHVEVPLHALTSLRNMMAMLAHRLKKATARNKAALAPPFSGAVR